MRSTIAAAAMKKTAAQVKSGNDGSGTTNITITYTAPGGATSVEVWRKGYGDYPTYASGSAPPLPGSYPPPGWTLTPLSERALSEKHNVKKVLQTIPLGRAGEPSEIGRAAVFLASDDAAWITGKVLRVDGGAYM